MTPSTIDTQLDSSWDNATKYGLVSLYRTANGWMAHIRFSLLGRADVVAYGNHKYAYAAVDKALDEAIYLGAKNLNKTNQNLGETA